MNDFLHFIGTGGAFSKNHTNNAAYCINGNKMILFDCGETVFHEIIKNDIIDDAIDSIDIIITHFHSDHVGSLGSLIFYCRYKQLKEVNVIFPIKKIPLDLLDIFGIDRKLYNLKYPMEVEEYYLKEYSQLHGDIDENGVFLTMPSYGYHVKYKNINFYYSGDTAIIKDEVLEKFQKKEIDVMYHEVTTDGYPTHVQLDYLEKCIPLESRDRVCCMHMGDSVNIKKIKELGFRSVR